jgi:phage shock protein PspC (stress-responsive transcriptional regulator)
MDTEQTTEPIGAGPPDGGGRAAPEPRPRLTRSRDDKLLGGVCGGLGRHFGVDPIIFRIAFVALALAGASGVLLYALGWLLIPPDGQAQARAVAAVHGRDWSRPLAAVLVVLGIGLLLGGLRPHGGRSEAAAALVLTGLGVALYLSERDARPAPSPAGASVPTAEPPPPEPPPAPPTWPAAPTPPPGPAPGPPPSAPPAPRRPRSPLGPMTLSGLLVLAGVALLVDRAGWVDVSLAAFLAVALVAVGLALVVSAWWGRALVLIPVGIVLACALALVSVLDVPIGAGIGERRVRPAGPGRLRPTYELAVGELTVDLAELPAGARRADVAARVGIGHLVVLVPPGAGVVADGRVGAGEVVLFGRVQDGTTVRHRAVRPPATEGAGRLHLHVSAGVGQVEVRDAAA